MSLLNTALRFSEYQPQPFVAPIPLYNGTVEIFTVQNGVPLRYKMRGHPMGWWELIPTKHNTVTIRKHAEAYDVGKYLSCLPRFYVIACIPAGVRSWMVVPYNASDAAQRGWLNGQPRSMYLVYENIQPFDILVARQLGGALLYDHLDYRLGEITRNRNFVESMNTESGLPFPHSHSWRNAWNIVREWQAKAEQAAQAEHLQEQLAQTENKLRFLLEFMGAKLVHYEKRGTGYRVAWEAPDGHTYTMGVREDGYISVAGLCLAGTDSQHNLSSIVQVMEEAQRLHRPDLPNGDYDEDDETDPYDD